MDADVGQVFDLTPRNHRGRNTTIKPRQVEDLTYKADLKPQTNADGRR